MFSEDHRARAARYGIDIEESYKLMLLEVRVGGPVFERLRNSVEGRTHCNLESRRTRDQPCKPRPFIRLVSAPSSPQGDLTARQVEILELAAAGKRVPAIAAALCIGEETVKSHLKSSRERLAARNTTEAVAIAVRRRLITAEAA